MGLHLSGNPDEWLSALQPHEREQAAPLLAENLNPDEIAGRWLDLVAQGTIGYGGPQGETKFKDSFMAELRKFVCGDPAYEETRKKVQGAGSVSKDVVITVVATAIASNIGAMAALLTAPVAICLCAVGRVGVTAWCNWQTGGSSNPPANPTPPAP